MLLLKIGLVTSTYIISFANPVCDNQKSLDNIVSAYVTESKSTALDLFAKDAHCGMFNKPFKLMIVKNYKNTPYVNKEKNQLETVLQYQVKIGDHEFFTFEVSTPDDQGVDKYGHIIKDSKL